MDDNNPPIIKFDANRAADDLDSQVRCPRCNKLIFMHANRCSHCGVNFNGEAWQFSPSTESRSFTSVFSLPRWLIVAIAITVLLSLILASF